MPNFPLYFLYAFCFSILDCECPTATSYIKQEILQNVFAMLCQIYFWVKLYTVELLGLICYCYVKLKQNYHYNMILCDTIYCKLITSSQDEIK